MLELSDQLSKSTSIYEKNGLLDSHIKVREFLEAHSYLRPFFLGLSPECELALKQLIAIGQADRLFAGINETNIELDKLRDLLEKLVSIDHFYREIGGIAGYQATICELLKGRGEEGSAAHYHSPNFVDITEETPFVKEAIEWGIDSMAEMGEIYPLGGAADRLHLVDQNTGVELPAAKLPFAGKSLLAHLIYDLEAREYLYTQKTGKKIVTPIAIMTSSEKNNSAHVLEIFEEANWFHRPKDSVRFFYQPLVPSVDENGNWCLLGPLRPLLKPGGHGAIWKLARDGGILNWFEKLGRKKALIRQINNPLAGLDYGLLAFTGYGCKKEKIFGFASCPRLLEAAEGVNVVVEKGNEIVLTNIEYCDFAKFGIEDRPLKEGEPFSKFSSNTNILFADLKAISSAVETCPFPGLLINLKKTSYTLASGEKKEGLVARLESTMQNIADVFVEEKGEGFSTQNTFVTYNKRNKTISTAKKAFVPGGPLKETPENCFYDLIMARRELLLKCGVSLPPPYSKDEYLEKGPDCLFLYHPVLGPLYSTIAQKISGGKFSLGSELIVEMVHFKAVNLNLSGSLQVIAENPMGESLCILENVSIVNKGVDWASSSPFWKMEKKNLESVKIILKGTSSFIARNVQLEGGSTYVVQDGEELLLPSNCK